MWDGGVTRDASCVQFCDASSVSVRGMHECVCGCVGGCGIHRVSCDVFLHRQLLINVSPPMC